PRAHRPTEQRVQHVARIPIVVVLRVAADADAQVTLFELLVANLNLRHHAWRLFADHLARRVERSELLSNQLPDALVFEVPHRRHDQVSSGVSVLEVVPERVGAERLDGFLRAENRPAERVMLPEAL